MSKILVADDTAYFREPIAATLRAEGHQTVCAADGVEALKQARQHQPDLVLLDIAMPNMDGLQCLREMRCDTALSKTPVIMLTAMAERQMVERAVGFGVQGYLLKSQFSLQELLARVRGALQDAREEAPPPKGQGSESQPAEPRPNAEIVQPGNPSPADRKAERSQQSISASVAIPAPLLKADVQERVAREFRMRAFPPVLSHVMALTQSSRSSVNEVADAVAEDQALAMKVLRVANSSFFGSGKHVKNLGEASQRIGMSGIRNAAAAILTIEHFANAAVKGMSLQRFWEHSLLTAVLAEALAEHVGDVEGEQLFLAGLLHDTGRMILSSVFPSEYEAALAFATQERMELTKAELKIFELTHADITREALDQLQAPRATVDAAALHDASPEYIRHAAADPKGALIVALADRLAHALAQGDSGNAMLLPVAEWARALDVPGPLLAALADESVKRTRDIATFYFSQSSDMSIESVLAQMTRAVDTPPRVAIIAGESRGDPLSLFCGQLRWLNSDSPSIAIICIHRETELSRRLSELQKLEQRLGHELGIVVISPDASVSLTASLAGNRPVAALRLPERYDWIIKTLARVHQQTLNNARTK